MYSKTDYLQLVLDSAWFCLAIWGWPSCQGTEQEIGKTWSVMSTGLFYSGASRHSDITRLLRNRLIDFPCQGSTDWMIYKVAEWVIIRCLDTGSAAVAYEVLFVQTYLENINANKSHSQHVFWVLWQFDIDPTPSIPGRRVEYSTMQRRFKPGTGQTGNIDNTGTR